jgi:hypothetical protein
MDNRLYVDKLDLAELANKLFMYTDEREWQKLLDEVFLPVIWFDMTNSGGDRAELPSHQVCDLWRIGFTGLDSIHHQAGHYLISVDGENADIYGYAIAIHYKKNTTAGNTRTYAGSYDLKAKRSPEGWRISQFKYNLKFTYGNINLE